jgi:hypothetical protein
MLRKEDNFDFKIVESPEKLYETIKEKNSQKGMSARIVAGYCWPWSTKLNDVGELVKDVKFTPAQNKIVNLCIGGLRKLNIYYGNKRHIVKWHCKNKGYVAGHVKKDTVYMHQIFMNCYGNGRGFSDKSVDHINRNKSDNRFENLREASNSQNRANSKTANVHGLKGVRRLPWMKEADKCWQASITHNKKVIYLGCFHTKEEAHSAYCEAAKTLHGEFFNS